MDQPADPTPGFLRRTFERVRPRMTPSLIIIGAQKAGTTALFRMLAEHPKGLRPKIKELHFFTNGEAYAKGMARYRTFFSPIPVKSRGYFTFEASPGYLIKADVAAPRIAQSLPKVVCLAILRDPVARAYSAWNMFRDFKGNPKHGDLYDPRSFQQAIEDELAGRTKHDYHQYLARSCYAGQIQVFKNHFPEERLIIRSYLEFKADPAKFVNDLCARLGWAAFPEGHKAFALKANKRTYPEPLDPGLAVELRHYFTPELKKLNEVLGYELDIVEQHA